MSILTLTSTILEGGQDNGTLLRRDFNNSYLAILQLCLNDRSSGSVELEAHIPLLGPGGKQVERVAHFLHEHLL